MRRGPWCRTISGIIRRGTAHLGIFRMRRVGRRMGMRRRFCLLFSRSRGLTSRIMYVYPSLSLSLSLSFFLSFFLSLISRLIIFQVLGEIKRPRRTFPLGMMTGISIISVLYMAVNICYVSPLSTPLSNPTHLTQFPDGRRPQRSPNPRQRSPAILPTHLRRPRQQRDRRASPQRLPRHIIPR